MDDDDDERERLGQAVLVTLLLVADGLGLVGLLAGVLLLYLRWGRP